jgi:hypothetical protein
LGAALALSAGLSACVTPTPYQPAVVGHPSAGGYSETRIEPDRWRVTFAGNSMTSRDTVEAYLLFRAAEVTLQNGFDWFEMVDRSTSQSGRTYVTPTGPYPFWAPTWRWRGHGFGWRTWDPFWGDPFWADSVDVQTVLQFEASAEIMTHKGAKPEGDARAFDAHGVVANLQPRIVYPGKK